MHFFFSVCVIVQGALFICWYLHGLYFSCMYCAVAILLKKQTTAIFMVLSLTVNLFLVDYSLLKRTCVFHFNAP